MQTRDFHYDLPQALIAQQALPQRRASRLLCLDGSTGGIRDQQFRDLPEILRPGDILIFNDTRVIPARLLGVKSTGGKVEVLVERVLDDRQLWAQVKASKPPKPSGQLLLEEAFKVRVMSRNGDLFKLENLDHRPWLELLYDHGRTPLPPYIDRPAVAADRSRYQTVYARHPGAVAAPTAGLHFDEQLLAELKILRVELEFITLHVGAGTFQPVRAQQIEQHTLHSETAVVTPQVCDAIKRCRARGGRVVAVGTTTVRGLETAAFEGTLRPFSGETQLFITPGFRFRVIDAVITNFHLPGSTLLMLVSAVGGHHHVMAAYRHAVRQRYRFYSYGDAMLITRGVVACN
jgi:S-adenosylmethionine:tRNA ribosyltransferase-isomerase